MKSYATIVSGKGGRIGRGSSETDNGAEENWPRINEIFDPLMDHIRNKNLNLQKRNPTLSVDGRLCIHKSFV